MEADDVLWGAEEKLLRFSDLAKVGLMAVDAEGMDSISAASASAITQANIRSSISMAVARKSLDTMKSQGDAAVSLIKSAAEVSQGASSHPGRLDVVG